MKRFLILLLLLIVSAAPVMAFDVDEAMRVGSEFLNSDQAVLNAKMDINGISASELVGMAKTGDEVFSKNFMPAPVFVDRMGLTVSPNVVDDGYAPFTYAFLKTVNDSNAQDIRAMFLLIGAATLKPDELTDARVVAQATYFASKIPGREYMPTLILEALDTFGLQETSGRYPSKRFIQALFDGDVTAAKAILAETVKMAYTS